jgi:hypothetical protein
MQHKHYCNILSWIKIRFNKKKKKLNQPIKKSGKFINKTISFIKTCYMHICFFLNPQVFSFKLLRHLCILSSKYKQCTIQTTWHLVFIWKWLAHTRFPSELTWTCPESHILMLIDKKILHFQLVEALYTEMGNKLVYVFYSILLLNENKNIVWVFLYGGFLFV